MSIDFTITNDDILPEVLLVKPNYFSDYRGIIYSTYRDKDFINHGLPVFTHDKVVISRDRVLRGIHGDSKTFKLVSCISGSVEQVVVDCRRNSKTYKKWTKFNLEGGSSDSILIPPGYGNAFLVTSGDGAIYNYKLSYEGQYVDSDEQFTYEWNDKSIGIEWSISNPILSDRDGCNRQ